jgi:hypothetical protein
MFYSVTTKGIRNVLNGGKNVYYMCARVSGKFTGVVGRLAFSWSIGFAILLRLTRKASTE